MSYEGLARFYDALTGDVDYPAIADYYETFFQKSRLPIHTVLDLGCGTGTLTTILAERGYEMIGADSSPEMLGMAAEKTADWEENRPIYLNQSMDELDLFGTIDACVSCLDSINYITDLRQLKRTFQRVHTFLMPGGLFIFDINSPEKLRGLDGQMFLDETEDVYCVWRAEYDKRRKICTYGFDLFEREDDIWYREGEVHEERAYEPEELARYLTEAGFASVKFYGDRKQRAPKPGEQRIFIVCRKGQYYDGTYYPG